MKSSRSAFTLVELLVVIGLIGVLAGVLGLALGRGNSGAALQSSQATLQGLFAAARGQAAINQGDAYVIVNVDTNSEGFLREFYVVAHIAANPTAGTPESYRAVGSPVTLSKGVYLVPSSTGETYGGAVTLEGSWNNRVSDAFAGDAIAPAPENITGTFVKVSGMTDRGISIGNGKLVLAPAEPRDANTLVFRNPDAVRGVSISRYGVLTFLNDSGAMQP